MSTLTYTAQPPKDCGWYWCLNLTEDVGLWEAIVRIERTRNGLIACWMTAPGAVGMSHQSQWNEEALWCEIPSPKQPGEDAPMMPEMAEWAESIARRARAEVDRCQPAMSDLYELRQVHEGFLKASVRLFGVPHEVEMTRVDTSHGDQRPWVTLDRDQDAANLKRIAAIHAMRPYAYRAVSVAGFPGTFLCTMVPTAFDDPAPNHKHPR